MITIKNVVEHIGKTDTTIRRWTKEFADHLSPEANPPAGQARAYSEDDIAILNTINVLANQRRPFTEIHKVLSRGERLEPLKEEPKATETPAETPPVTQQVDQSPQQALMDPDLLKTFLTMVETANTAMLGAEKRAIKAELERDKATEDKEALQSRIDELERRGFWARLFNR